MSLNKILRSKLGFGAAPLGNMFRDIPEAEAFATVNAAWDDGIRYFDNAPFYGAGLAEIRMGEALKARPRDQYVISTKVGRIILDEVEDVSARDLGEKGEVFKHGRPNKIVLPAVLFFSQWIAFDDHILLPGCMLGSRFGGACD